MGGDGRAVEAVGVVHVVVELTSAAPPTSGVSRVSRRRSRESLGGACIAVSRSSRLHDFFPRSTPVLAVDKSLTRWSASALYSADIDLT